MDAATLKITHPILKLVAEIDEFKGRWCAVRTLSSGALQQLRESSNIESVGSSTRIEGIPFSDAEVAAFLAGPNPETFRNRNEAETAGYAAALKMLDEEGESSPLTEARIRHIHQALMQFSSGNTGPSSEYKKNPNSVATFDGAGKQTGFLFETASPMQTPVEMARLTEWLTQAEAEGLHPLFITALFVYRFLAIHPFQEGNGRLSCILATALLLRFGYSYMPYASLERMIEENRSSYYDSLRKTHQSLKWATPEWEIWVEFFLGCLARHKEKLERRIEAEQAAPMDLSGLALSIVDMLEMRPRVTVASVVQATGASRHSVRATFRSLVQNSLVVPKGKGRGSHYSFIR